MGGFLLFNCRAGRQIKETQPADWARAPQRAGFQADLDLANQVQRGSQSGFAFFPLGRADFAGVGSYVLGSLDLAQQVGSVTADTFGSDFTAWMMPCGSTMKVPRLARP